MTTNQISGKNWRGAPWERSTLGFTWGDCLVSGWGIFEFIDLCEAAGITPVITTNADDGSSCCAPEDMADLVEYCYGDASTTWGSQRIQDGHPDPYNVQYIELGNEQYNSKYVDQVIAMEERAAKVKYKRKLWAQLVVFV